MSGKGTIGRSASGVLLLGALALGFSAVRKGDMPRMLLSEARVEEAGPPALPADLASPAILVFSETKAFRHHEAIPAAHALFARFAADNGWGHFQTENSAAFAPEILARFDAVVFNNVTGDVFTSEQRAALREYIEGGGGFVGIHAAGDSSHPWDWYADELIGARFIGHTMDPQFPPATVLVEDASHPATADLPASWTREEEWYSFAASPRSKGYHILVRVDESSYAIATSPRRHLAMGEDHPMAWWHCQGEGRAFYSAFGHRGSAYDEPEHQRLLLGATRWALRLAGEGCGERE